ncbi:carboxylase:pyruvate/acetyl-coa/propionyl-coa [Culex quinquefasciatus]|uniref:Carboxylase:pyruvate/acetyl-coa/propionyl-coa n=1 Tax=Culex quinquefasciatus TaxID=7176 RepID=B0X137_CULQU|nr:carboxylase:pyruvate/acetyl-coa/propionyl-coa [Culex quinquefasciatus]|eukprot:XP_001863359.1 carboxylase:pyruvate/acetyl-coa/propionyl-coa [Culex quinquefasciatus]
MVVRIKVNELSIWLQADFQAKDLRRLFGSADINEKAKVLNSELTSLLDAHAPERTDQGNDTIRDERTPKTGASGRKQSVGWDTAEAISSSSSVNISRVETHPVRAGCEPRRNRYHVFLVCNELGMPSVAIYSEQNRQHMHRQKADESYIDGKGLAPVEVCNTFQKLSGCARRTTSTTCTPVKGHIGPSPKVVQQMGDKVAARKAAIEAGVLIVPETDGPVTIKVEVLVFCKKHGFPVIFKASGAPELISFSWD